MSIIELKNVSKYFHYYKNKTYRDYIYSLINKHNKVKHYALNDINIKINKNEFVGLIGKNGSGKSTLIKIMLGILVPSTGNVNVLGKSPQKSRIENNMKIGAVFGQRTQLRWDISAYESYKLLKHIYRISEHDFNNRYKFLNENLELDTIIHKPVRTLSLGQKMKVELCAAFLHEPEILFLDEPTIGLDIFAKDTLINVLKKIKQTKKTTVILTTHDVREIDELCERAIIIDEGKIIFDNKTEMLEKNVSLGVDLEVFFNNTNINIPDVLDNSKLTITNKHALFKNISKKEIPSLINFLLINNNVDDLKLKHPDFKEILKDFYASKTI